MDVVEDSDEFEQESPFMVDLSSFLKDTLRSCDLQSAVPELCQQEECCMGIDEAGRGPVLGPMVYGTAFCPLSKRTEVKALGVADSKVLSEEKREEIFGAVVSHQQLLGWKVNILSPNFISNSMMKICKYNLNAISHDSAIGLIRKVLADGVNVKEVFVDTVGDPGKYQDLLHQIFPQLQITVAKKADSLYPIVSAASICAKVVRDACMKNWVFVERNYEGRPVLCSGYPSDPHTKAWLEGNVDAVFGYPTLVRFSWSTCRNQLDSTTLPVEWEDDGESDASVGCAKISSFFSKASQPKKRHRYFRERGLNNVTEF